MSTQPFVNIEDQPPNLRFQSTAAEDRIASEETGKMEYMDIIKVFIRAAGDMKCEVPDIAKKTAYRTYTKTVSLPKKVTKWVEGDDGQTVQKEETVTVEEQREFHEPYVRYPWKEKLQDRLKNGKISQRYYDYCVDALERFMKNQDIPVEGTPLVDWMGAPESQKKKLIEMGINSVEKLADMTEGAIQNFGMGGRDLKNKALAYLSANRDGEKTAEEIVTLKSQNEQMSEQLTALQQKLQEIEQQSGQSKGSQEIEKLRAEYEEVVGKKPHHMAGVAKLQEDIKKAKSEAEAA